MDGVANIHEPFVLDYEYRLAEVLHCEHLIVRTITTGPDDEQHLDGEHDA